jgi:acetylornithine deacetylase/succinyl-diaminopimelate desuccinylase-like protein
VTTAGFDGSRAWEHVRLGRTRPASSRLRSNPLRPDLHRSSTKSLGYQVEEHAYQATSPLGVLSIKNIIAKAPGTDPGIVLYATHYDTVRIPNFVGARDGGSGTGNFWN